MIQETLLISSMKPYIDHILSKIIIPKIDSFIKHLGIKYNELLVPKGEHFREYLYRTYKKYSFINTLVLKNEQRLLKNLYIPLTIYKSSFHNEEEKEEKTKINGYPINLMRKYDRILITDTAGMGKSTLVKYIYLDIINKGHGIPIFIEMRRLNKDHSILNEIKKQINPLNNDFDLNILYKFIQTGEFIFILDGYDEISLEERSAVTKDIQEFISKAGNNKFILTSRPEEYLAGFGDFQRFSINPLTKAEAYELLRKYDSKGETSELLISELKTGKYEMINDFLKNPLLVSLLFAAFDYKQTIPLKKHIFYRQVYDAYFDSHDLSKGDGYIHEKKSKLDIDDFDRVLRYVGFKCLKCQKIEFDKDSLLKIIEEAKQDCVDINFCSSDFLYDLLHTVPLFCNDGQYYKWVHKSIQEYFAAQFIYKDAKNNQDIILKAMYNSDFIEKYINLLDIYYDIDKWGFRKNITRLLCEEYCKFHESNIINLPQIDKDYIDDRIGYLFLRDTCILKHNITSEEKIDPFTSIGNITEQFLGNKINAITLFHGASIFVVNHLYPRRALVKLMYSKEPNLFKHKKTRFADEVIPFENEKIYKIDLKSFTHNNNQYNLINRYLRDGCDFSNIFNYDKCKIEAETINSVLKNKNNSSDIVEGL